MFHLFRSHSARTGLVRKKALPLSQQQSKTSNEYILENWNDNANNNTTDNRSGVERPLSAWEQWVVDKAKAERRRLEEELAEQEKQREQLDQERHKKEKLKAEAAEKLKVTHP